MKIKSFIDIAPAKDQKVCGNCESFRLWGVSTGNCFARKRNPLKLRSQTCSKFELKTTEREEC